MASAGAAMSELKRSHSLYCQPGPARRAACRAAPVADLPKLATEASELQLLEPGQLAIVEGGDPYNGIGSRAVLRRAAAAPMGAPARK
jgi:hypothetical protein